MQFATNHLGPFLFTNLILPLISTSSSSNEQDEDIQVICEFQKRIINTSSEAHRISPIRFSDYNLSLSSSAQDLLQLPEDERPRQNLPPGILRNDGGYESAIAYGQSKTANILFSVGLRSLMGVSSFAVMPGSESFPPPSSLLPSYLFP